MSRAKLFVCAVVVLFAANRSGAVDYDFAKIADTNTTVPLVTGTFNAFGTTPALDGFNVALTGTRTSPSNYVAAYVSNGGVLAKLVDTNTPIPDGAGNFLGFNLRTVSGSKIAFTPSPTGSGVYTSDLVRVADFSTPVPGSAGFQFNAFNSPSMDGSGNVVFRGAFTSGGPTQDGIYSSVGGLNVVANRNTAVPSGTGNFIGFGTGPSIDGGELAFSATGNSGQQGIYATTGGSLHVIANTSTAIPGGTGSFISFPDAQVVSAGNVAFIGQGNAQGGVYTDIGGLNAVADGTTPIPSGTGNFSSFSALAFSGGSVAFLATGSGTQQGVYTNYGGTLTRVIDKSVLLDGKQISSITLGSDAISNGNISFQATFADSSKGIFVAQQSYEYTANTSGNWDSASNWSFGLKPRAVVSTNIHPDYGTVITGPSTATTVRSLDLNANISGVAELRLQPSGQLTVNEFLYVNDKAKLNLNGGVAAVNFGAYNYGEVDLAGGQISGGFLSNLGVLHGSGLVGNNVLNFNRIDAIGTSMRFTSSVDNTIINDIDNQPVATGQINVRNAQVDFAGGLNNVAGLNVSFGTSDIFGAVTNAAANSGGPPAWRTNHRQW